MFDLKMNVCASIGFSNEFSNPKSDCIYIFNCHFNTLSGCIDLQSIGTFFARESIFENISGNIPLIIDSGEEIEFSKICFSKCEHVSDTRTDGSICKISQSNVLNMTETSFFGCCTSMLESQNRYISYLTSSALTLINSNNSFNRAMRGTGALLINCEIKRYSRCIYASGYCYGSIVYTHSFQKPGFIYDLIFIHNMLYNENDYFHSLFTNGYGTNDDITLMSSFFDNSVSIFLRTTDTNGKIISKGNTFSKAFSEVKNKGNIVMSEDDNTFESNIIRTHPARFDHLFVCPRIILNTRRVAKRSILSFSIIIQLVENSSMKKYHDTVLDIDSSIKFITIKLT